MTKVGWGTWRRRWAAVAMAVAAVALVVTAAPAGSAQSQPTPEEKAAALARPALVFIETHWSGYVRDLSPEGGIYNPPGRIEFSLRCSGFVVDPDGYIVTAGHCVDPAEAAFYFFDEVAFARDVDYNEQIDYLADNGRVEGQLASTEGGDREVFVQRGVAKSGLTDGEAMPARVVSLNTIDEGDVAVLKVDRDKMASVELAPGSDVQIGTPILAIGYPGSVDYVADATFEPSNKDGKVSAKKTSGGVPFYEISAAVSGGMSGGPVVDLEGRVVGLVSFGPAEEAQAFNFISTSTIINEALTRNGVKNELGPLDIEFRKGLAKFYDRKYDDAIEIFDEVLDSQPSHQQAQEFKTRAVDLDAAAGDGGGGAPVALLGLALAVAAAGGGLVAMRKRNTKTAGASGGGQSILANAHPLPMPPPPPPPSIPAPPGGYGAPSLDHDTDDGFATTATAGATLHDPPPPQPPPAPPAADEAPAPVAAAPTTTTTETEAEVAAPAAFCNKCGTRRNPRDAFCASCGNKLA